uniref:Uncharacterized protein n=1 Tax=Rhizophora mucronata TaxID=61149 RepID=A0A2P2IMZ9_RHIMU
MPIAPNRNFAKSVCVSAIQSHKTIVITVSQPSSSKEKQEN